MDRYRPWSDLPVELLSPIADQLALIELLSFRGTCKGFRSASTEASAKNGSETPWLIFHKDDSSECVIYNQHNSKAYKRNIPELQGAICLASYEGWLLLSKDETIFFFSPFSLAKIALPNFPNNQIDGLVGAFSHVPTSPQCIVSVISSIDETYVEVHTISKGENVWTRYKTPKRFSLKTTIVGATFDHENETFYYMDSGDSTLTFSVKDKVWKPYHIVNVEATSKDIELLPYRCKTRMFRDIIENIKKHEKAGLEDDEHVVVCGLTNNDVRPRPMVYCNEIVDVSPLKSRVRRAVWIQPRFFEADPNQHW
ncbi:F-box domain-containing protein [Artemisia annua]|uniref:F-box domain-containing protein n=1 Tax=Artemisia annua TaxID=35608 RepID=A0A2U1MHW3_ARTAN|nr:F-box domain-containing protein [Artemisia annua]